MFAMRDNTWLPFDNLVQERIEPILEQVGFKLEGVQTEDQQALMSYKRSRNSQLERIWFDGLAWFLREGERRRDFNWLRVYASVGSTQIDLRELTPDFTSTHSASVTLSQGWEYIDELSLKKCIEEIAMLIQEHLLSWFDHPIVNPAGIDTVVSDSERLSALKKEIALFEEKVKVARQFGHDDLAADYQRRVEQLKLALKGQT
jgi:hypothetical protein